MKIAERLIDGCCDNFAAYATTSSLLLRRIWCIREDDSALRLAASGSCLRNIIPLVLAMISQTTVKPTSSLLLRRIWCIREDSDLRPPRFVAPSTLSSRATDASGKLFYCGGYSLALTMVSHRPDNNNVAVTRRIWCIGRIRTSDRLGSSRVLCPAELRMHRDSLL